MPGPDDLVGLGGRIDQGPHGPRPVLRGDPGRDAVPGVHADGERGAHPLGVVRGHQRQLKPVQVRPGERHADHAAGVPDHERHQGRRYLAGRDDDVALVLPVGVVHHDYRTAVRDVLDRPLDFVEHGLAKHVFLAHELTPSFPAWLAGPAASRLSTYLAITSTSRFTRLPGWAAERGHLQRGGDEADLEPGLRSARAPRAPGGAAEGRDGQADPVHGDRALQHDVPGQAGRGRDAHHVPVLTRGAGQDLPGAVGVTLDQVPAQPGRPVRPGVPG